MMDRYQRFVTTGEHDSDFGLLHQMMDGEPLQQALLDIYLAHPSPITSSTSLRSNGSSGEESIQNYAFGPSFEHVRAVIEGRLTNPIYFPKRFRRVMLVSPFPDPWTSNQSCTFGRDQLSFDLCGSTEGLIGWLRRLLRREDGVILYTFPRIINVLADCEAFIKCCAARTDRLVICSVDSDGLYRRRPFLDSGVIVNDHMINWKTGVNFFTDVVGGRRSLMNLWAERDGRYYKLLNLADKRGVPIDDAITMSDDRVVSFLPHVDHLPKTSDGRIIYDLSLLDRVEGHYLNMQFLYDNAAKPDHIEMHVMSDSDRDLIEVDAKILENRLGIGVTVIHDSAFWIGRKYLSFWGRPSSVSFRTRQ